MVWKTKREYSDRDWVGSSMSGSAESAIVRVPPCCTAAGSAGAPKLSVAGGALGPPACCTGEQAAIAASAVPTARTAPARRRVLTAVLLGAIRPPPPSTGRRNVSGMHLAFYCVDRLLTERNSCALSLSDDARSSRTARGSGRYRGCGERRAE